MKKQSYKSKWRTDTVDFALIPSPVRKDKQFRLPDDLSDLFCYGRAISRSVFSRFFEFSHHGQTAVQGFAKCFPEGREGVKLELGFAFFRGWEMGFCALGLGFMIKKR